jgi:hypothetical protein
VNIFLGSSKESTGDMRRVAQWIESTNNVALRWDNPSLFPAGQYILPTLVELSRTLDGAILIFGEDDQVWYRNDSQRQPRDNVLLEYGLFMAALGQQNTIVCVKGNPKIPSDLQGLIHADLSKPARAEEQISRWIRDLKRRPDTSSSPQHQILAKIREQVSVGVEQQARPFLSWLCSQHLTATLQAIEPIRQQTEKQGAVLYRQEVLKQLKPERTDTVLALCGRKFTLQQENRTYFNEFYEFAKQRQAREPKHRDGIYVCRLFVEDEKGQLAPFMDEEFERHKENRENGILGLSINSQKRNHLDQHIGPGFSNCLDEGFGFLLFYSYSGTSTVIIHEGTDHNMAFVKLTDDLNLHSILEIYKTLCTESVQYLAENTRLKEFLERLQLALP